MCRITHKTAIRNDKSLRSKKNDKSDGLKADAHVDDNDSTSKLVNRVANLSKKSCSIYIPK